MAVRTRLMPSARTSAPPGHAAEAVIRRRIATDAGADEILLSDESQLAVSRSVARWGMVQRPPPFRSPSAWAVLALVLVGVVTASPSLARDKGGGDRGGKGDGSDRDGGGHGRGSVAIPGAAAAAATMTTTMTTVATPGVDPAAANGTTTISATARGRRARDCPRTTPARVSRAGRYVSLKSVLKTVRRHQRAKS